MKHEPAFLTFVDLTQMIRLGLQKDPQRNMSTTPGKFQNRPRGQTSALPRTDTHTKTRCFLSAQEHTSRSCERAENAFDVARGRLALLFLVLCSSSTMPCISNNVSNQAGKASGSGLKTHVTCAIKTYSTSAILPVENRAIGNGFWTIRKKNLFRKMSRERGKPRRGNERGSITSWWNLQIPSHSGCTPAPEEGQSGGGGDMRSAKSSDSSNGEHDLRDGGHSMRIARAGRFRFLLACTPPCALPAACRQACLRRSTR